MISVGPFDLHDPIAKGGMGEVWRGQHRSTGAWVAVKVLRASAARHERLVSAIQTEIRASAALEHPNIVWLYDAGLATEASAAASSGRIRVGSPWFAMELAHGGTLQQRANSLEWIGVRRVLLDLLDALAHAHARGVVHRDIKPSNVLFMGKGTRIKLADFGMVYAIETDRGDAPITGGTPSYMAPEQFEGDGRVQGPWTDLYSVGCMAWLLVSGRRPFGGPGASALYRKHAASAVPPLEPRFGIPDGLDAWVAKLMAKAPGDRFQRAAEAARALIDFPMPSEVGTMSPDAGRMELDSETQRTTLVLPPKGTQPRRLAPAVKRSLFIPDDWRATHRRGTLHLKGAGLGLFGLRELPLVNRNVERDALWEELSEANRTQSARTVILRGPSGYGKSRLAEWLCRRAHEVGAAQVFTATQSATPGPRHGVSGMVGRALRAPGLDQHEFRDLVDQLLPRAPAWACQGAEYLCIPFFRIPPTQEVFPIQTVAERHAIASRVVRELSGGRVATIWLDDVQWDADTIAWAQHVMQRQDAGPALLILTAQEEALARRPEEDELLELLAGQARTLEIGPLSDPDGQLLANTVLSLDPELAQQLADRTSGNPLFAVQLVGDWVAKGLLVEGENGFTLLEDTSTTLPQDVAAVWTARIDALLEQNPEWEGPLEIAAVLGITVESAEWSLACQNYGIDSPGGLVLKLFSERLAIIDPHEGSRRWRFVHSMLRETLQDRSRKAGRIMAIHQACATTLEDRGPAHADRLANHLLGAELIDDAVDALFITGSHYGLTDMGRATTSLQQREQLLDRINAADSRRIAGWQLLAVICRRRGDLAGARDWAQRILNAATDQKLVGNTHLEMARCEREAGNKAQAESHIDKVIAVATKINEPVMLAKALVERSAALQQIGDLAGAEKNIRRALTLDPIDPGTRAHANLHLSFLLSSAGEHAAALRQIERAWEAVEASKQNNIAAIYWNTFGEVARGAGDLDRAEAAYKKASALAEQLGYPFHSFTLNLGLVAIERGNADEADQHFKAVMQHERVVPVFRLYAAAGLMASASQRKDWRQVNALKKAIMHGPAVYSSDVAMLLERCGDNAQSAGEVALAAWAWKIALTQHEHINQPKRAAFLHQKLRALKPS